MMHEFAATGCEGTCQEPNRKNMGMIPSCLSFLECCSACTVSPLTKARQDSPNTSDHPCLSSALHCNTNQLFMNHWLCTYFCDVEVRVWDCCAVRNGQAEDILHLSYLRFCRCSLKATTATRFMALKRHMQHLQQDTAEARQSAGLTAVAFSPFLHNPLSTAVYTVFRSAWKKHSPL